MTAQPEEMIIFPLQVQHYSFIISVLQDGLKSKGVAERAKSLREHVVKIVNFWKKLPKSKQPKCDSYNIVKDAVDDPLTVA